MQKQGITFAPAAPRANAMALPMPLEDPVTTQTGVSTAVTLITFQLV